MKIKYSKERLNSNYKLGLYFVIAGTVMTIAFTIFSESNEFQLDSRWNWINWERDFFL